MIRTDELADVIAKRQEFLAALEARPRDKPDLVEATDASRSTVDRAITGLEEHGLVTRVDDCYRPTVTGRCVLSAYREYRQQLDDLERARDVLAPLGPDAAIDPAILAGATIEQETPYDAEYAFRETIDLLEDASRFRAVGAAVPPRYLADVLTCIRQNDLVVEFVVTTDVLELFRQREADTFRALTVHETVSLYRIDEPPQYAIWTVETTSGTNSGMAVYNETGVKGVITNGTPAMNEWAAERFEQYRGRASDFGSITTS